MQEFAGLANSLQHELWVNHEKQGNQKELIAATFLPGTVTRLCALPRYSSDTTHSQQGNLSRYYTLLGFGNWRPTNTGLGKNDKVHRQEYRLELDKFRRRKFHLGTFHQ